MGKFEDAKKSFQKTNDFSQRHKNLPNADNFGFIGNFVNGLAPALQLPEAGGQYGFIDQQGKTIIDFEFALAKDFSEGLAVVAKAKHVSENVEIELSFLEKLMNKKFIQKQARSNYLYGFIDPKGFLKIPLLY